VAEANSSVFATRSTACPGDARHLAAVTGKVDTVLDHAPEPWRQQPVDASEHGCRGTCFLATAELRAQQRRAIVHVGEDELVHTGACEIAEVGRMPRSRSAVAQHGDGGKARDQGSQRGPDGLVLRVPCFREHAGHVTSALTHRRVQVGDVEQHLHRQGTEGGHQSLSHDTVADEEHDDGGAHRCRLPPV